MANCATLNSYFNLINKPENFYLEALKIWLNENIPTGKQAKYYPLHIERKVLSAASVSLETITDILIIDFEFENRLQY